MNGGGGNGAELLLAKQQRMRRCIARAREVWRRESALPFAEDFDKQDIVILNLQRATEQALDMANHAVRVKKLGWAKNSAEAFALLQEAGIIGADMRRKMNGAAGFRNMLVHRYANADLEIVQRVVERDADDLLQFAALLIAAAD